MIEPSVMIDRQSSPTVGQPPAPEVRPPAGPAGNPPAIPPKRASKLRWLWLPVIAALCWAGYEYWPKIGPMINGPTAPTTKSGKKGGKGGGGGATPVVATRAHRGNIGVYYKNLGSVTPLQTVSVNSVVGGQLMTVAYREGDIVQKDQVLMEIDPRPFEVQLENAEGQLAKDQALLADARLDLTRYETLVKQNAVPTQTLDTQKALVDQDIGTVKSDQAMINSAKLNLVYCKITAKFTGRVGLRLVDPGNIVQANSPTPLVVLTQIEPISVLFPVVEDTLPTVYQKLRAGASLTVDAWDVHDTQKIATGKLVTIDNEIDQTTGTVRVRANFDNTNFELFPNQFVNVHLLVQEKTGVVLLSDAAIQRSSKIYVYVVKPDSTVTIRDITTGTSEGGETEITSGLVAGDEVVMTGVDKLQEGAKVNATVPGEKPASGGSGGKGAGGKTGGGKKGGGSSGGKSQ
jgi:multidrug efflux system membrane fusion protein